MRNVKMTDAKRVDKGQITTLTVRRSQSWHLEPVTPSHRSSQARTEQPLIILATFSHLYLETHKSLAAPGDGCMMSQEMAV